MNWFMIKKVKQAILNGKFDLNKATIWACLFDIDKKQTISSNDVQLRNCQFKNGVLLANDVIFYQILDKSLNSLLVLFAENEAGVKYPIGYFEMPPLNEGGDVIVTWDKSIGIFNINSNDREISYERFRKITAEKLAY